MDTSNLIVAIDLGSSNIVGLAGIKEGNKIKVVAVEKEPSEGAVRRGCIINTDICTSKVRKLITKLDNKLSTHISEVYVGIGGQSVRTIKNNVSRHLPDGTKISAALLDELNKEARNIPIAGTEIIDVLPNETYLNDAVVENPLGMDAKKIQVDMLLAVARQALSRNISTVFEKLSMPIAGLILSSKADAEAVLTKEDKNKGCVLVNFGGGTTEISIYCQGYLRQTTTIPLGGKNITMDIMSLGLVAEKAEQYKISIGSALLSTGEQLKDITLDAQGKGPIKPKDLNRVSVARIEEIVSNVVNQIKESGYKSEIKGGIIITGGASLLKDLPELLRKEAGMEVHCGTTSERITLDRDIDIQSPLYSQAMGMLLIAGETISNPMEKKDKQSWWGWKKSSKETEKVEVKPIEKREPEKVKEKEKEKEKPKPVKPQKEKKQEKTSLFDRIRGFVEESLNEDENESIK
ncbi:MAG: cell division protein FtsA [Bacteroidales bacterium]|nr:cell division protein FtsA [Bacteroidales bacterium]